MVKMSENLKFKYVMWITISTIDKPKKSIRDIRNVEIIHSILLIVSKKVADSLEPFDERIRNRICKCLSEMKPESNLKSFLIFRVYNIKINLKMK